MPGSVHPSKHTESTQISRLAIDQLIKQEYNDVQRTASWPVSLLPRFFEEPPYRDTAF